MKSLISSVFIILFISTVVPAYGSLVEEYWEKFPKINKNNQDVVKLSEFLEAYYEISNQAASFPKEFHLYMMEKPKDFADLNEAERKQKLIDEIKTSDSDKWKKMAEYTAFFKYASIWLERGKWMTKAGWKNLNNNLGLRTTELPQAAFKLLSEIYDSFHGTIPTDRAIALLSRKDVLNRTYLIRASNTLGNALTISYLDHAQIKHIRLSVQEDGTYTISINNKLYNFKSMSGIVKQLQTMGIIMAPKKGGGFETFKSWIT